MKIATLDIGGTSIKAGRFQEGKLAQVREYDTDAKLGGDHVIKKAIEILEGFPERWIQKQEKFDMPILISPDTQEWR